METQVILNLEYSNTVCLDIGAHRGLYTGLLSNKFSKVYAFEPHPHNIVTLQQSYTNNHRIEVVPKAVSDKTGTIKLYICNQSSTGHSLSNKILEASKAQNPEANDWRLTENNYVEVGCVTLDDFCKDMDVSFMKVDVEGGEDFLFNGAVELLKRKHPTILLEVHRFVDRKALSKFFIDLGYEISNLIENNIQEMDLGHYLLRWK